MSDELYQKTLLRLAADAHGAGRLGGACCTGREANAMCGDAIIFDARVDDARRITALANELKGCVLVQASASLLAQHGKGEDEAGISALRGQIEGMLNGGEAPGGVWTPYEIFKSAAAYRSRHSCVLLPVDALLKALKDCQPGG
jgi:nitrogen fixation NifU-like protein